MKKIEGTPVGIFSLKCGRIWLTKVKFDGFSIGSLLTCLTQKHATKIVSISLSLNWVIAQWYWASSMVPNVLILNPTFPLYHYLPSKKKKKSVLESRMLCLWFWNFVTLAFQSNSIIAKPSKFVIFWFLGAYKFETFIWFWSINFT